MVPVVGLLSNVCRHPQTQQQLRSQQYKLARLQTAVLIVVLPCISISTKLFLPTNALFIKT